MNFKEYREQTKRTLPDLGSDLLNSIHMTLGMGSEIEELYQALEKRDFIGAGEEISDENWYAANYCNIWNIVPELYPTESLFLPLEIDEIRLNESIKKMIIVISQLQDLDKKLLAYNKQVPLEKRKELIENLLAELHIIYESANINAHQSMENNINKLKVRFPDKFTQEKAINRNTDAERVELER